MAHVYLLKCADGSFYVGSTIGPLESRISQHREGVPGSYTSIRRPVELVWSHQYSNIGEAYAMERRIHGWCRAKMLALVAGDFARLHELARQPENKPPTAGRAQRAAPHRRLIAAPSTPPSAERSAQRGVEARQPLATGGLAT